MAGSEHIGLEFCDLDEVVLCHIIALLRDPLPLSQTCKALRQASQNSLCRKLWFQQWHLNAQVTHRYISWAVLSWRALAGSSAEELVRFLVHVMQASANSKQQYTEQLQIVPGYIASGNWLQYLRRVAPYADHLLYSTAAAAHPKLLPSLLQDWRESNREPQSNSEAPDRLSSSRHLQQAALQQDAGLGNSDSSPEEQQMAECIQQLESNRLCHGIPVIKYAVHLPCSTRLPNYKHNLLQSSLIAAATAGQHASVQLLLDQMCDIYGEMRPNRLDLLLSALESAVAAGNHPCLDSLLEGLAATGAAEHAARLKHRGSEADVQQFHLRHVLLSSRYLIVAAARSGDCEMLEKILDLLLPFCQLVRLQLPGALVAAGRRGHEAVLQRLLAVHLMSSRPLQLAAADAANRGWPQRTLAVLLQYMAAKHRYEMLQLLAKPIVIALQSGNAATADGMLVALQAEAELDQPESLRDVLLLLANKGMLQHVSWVLKVAPTVLVKLGQTAVAAALEGGYPEVAQLILDAGAERPAAYKAAAKRGELVAAVRSGNVAKVRALLTEVSIPLLWACEHSAATSSSSSSGSPGITPAAAGEAAAANANVSSGSVTQCLLSLLQCAADAGLPTSVQLLQLLLSALPADRSSESRAVVVQLVKYCMLKGACTEFDFVLRCAGRTQRARASVLTDFASSLQLPDDEVYLEAATNVQQTVVLPTCRTSSSSSAMRSNDSSSSQAAKPGSATAVPGPIATALLLMQWPGCSDMLSRYVVNPYLSTAHPAEYLGATVRPSLPAVFLPCLRGLTLLFKGLTGLEHLPVGARVKDAALYKLMVRIVLQSCDRDLLYAFLAFMEKHSEELLKGMPQEIEQAEEGHDEL